jgi:modification methylase
VPESGPRKSPARHRPEGPAAYLRGHQAALQRTLGALDLSPIVLAADSGSRLPLDDASVQLVVTSPPYPYVEMWDRELEDAVGLARGTLERDASHLPAIHRHLARTWRECHRLLDEGGMLCVNVGDATRTVGGEFQLFANHVQVVRACEEAGFRTLVPILWKKPTNRPNSFLGSGFAPPNAYVTLDCEHILLFRKGSRRRFPPRDPLRAASQFSKAERDRWFSQIWEVRGSSQRDHAASFPPEIPYRLIRMFSVLGDSVLDPFAGTGTTLRAAWELGRRPIGVEVDRARAARIRGSLPRSARPAADVIRSLIDRYG